LSGPSRLITSAANPKVKLWSSLLDKKGRDKSGLYLVEGPHLVAEAFASGAAIECVVRQHGRPLAADLEPFAPGPSAAGSAERTEPPGVPWYEATENVLAKCSDTVHHQGIFAVVRKERRSLEEVLDAPGALVLAADRVQDPGNVGAMIRSADAAGATAVLLGRGCADPYNPKTVRSTMGSIFHLPVLEVDLREALRQAASRGIRIVSAAPDAPITMYEADFAKSTWILMGSEAHGVSEDLLPLASLQVSIPMPGKAESLNVAAAASILLYEALRQRRFSR